MGVIVQDGLAHGSGNINSPLIGWHNIVTPSNIVATNQDADHPASNLGNPATHLRWQTDDDSSPVPDAATITITPGTADPIDYLAIAGHNLGSVGASILVEKNTGAGWVTLFPLRFVADDSPIIFRFTPQVLTGLRFTLGAGTDAKRIAVVYAGTILVLERNVYVGQTPLPHGRIRKVTNGRSAGGNFLGAIVTEQFLQTKVPLSLIAPAFYRTYMDDFLAAAKDTPFFFAWRPGDYPLETGYAWLTADPVPVNQGPSGLIALQLDMTGIVG